MTGLELLAVALGMRHGVDPDHLAAVDGLSRVRPSPLNGVLFALGHGGVVTLLAFPAASLLGRVDLEALHLPAFLLLLVAALNLYRLLKPTPPTPPKGLRLRPAPGARPSCPPGRAAPRPPPPPRGPLRPRV